MREQSNKRSGTRLKNRERDWGETLKVSSRPNKPYGRVMLARFTDFFTDFEKKKTDCFAV